MTRFPGGSFLLWLHFATPPLPLRTSLHFSNPSLHRPRCCFERTLVIGTMHVQVITLNIPSDNRLQCLQEELLLVHHLIIGAHHVRDCNCSNLNAVAVCGVSAAEGVAARPPADYSILEGQCKLATGDQTNHSLTPIVISGHVPRSRQLRQCRLRCLERTLIIGPMHVQVITLNTPPLYRLQCLEELLFLGHHLIIGAHNARAGQWTDL